MPWPVPLRALAHRNYRLFVAGQLASLVGTWMQIVAQGWLVYRLTGSSLQLGLVGFSAQMPVFLLSPVGGGIADRWPRRRVLLLAHPFGAPATVASGGAVCLAASAVFAWRMPGLRPLARQLLHTERGLLGAPLIADPDPARMDAGGGPHLS